MKKNIALLWPPIPHGPPDDRSIQPNMGMAYLAAVLRDEFNVSVIDANIIHQPFSDFYKHLLRKKGKDEIKVWDEITLKLIRLIEKTNPDILGVGSWSYNMPFVAEFTRLFKARNPNIPLIVGGINSTLMPDETLAVMPYVDYLVRGEGEYTFLELVQKLLNNQSINNVQGISFLKEGKVINNPKRDFIKNLDILPFFDYENFIGFDKWSKHKGFQFVQLLASRGCVGKCTFCSVYQMWKAQRFYSKEYLVKQTKRLLNLYDLKQEVIAFMDDNFVVDFNQTKKLVNLFKEKLPSFIWQIVDMRVDASSNEFLNYCSKKDCDFIGFGVESINAKSLKFMNKTISAQSYIKKVSDIIRITNDLGIKTALSSILGTPTETEKDMIKQANFYINIYNKYEYASFDICPLVVHPATNLWRDYKNKKIEIYKRPQGSPKRFYEGLYSDRWDHLLFMVPNAYRIPNIHMSNDKFEAVLQRIYHKDGLSLAGSDSKNWGQSREKIPLIKNH